METFWVTVVSDLEERVWNLVPVVYWFAVFKVKVTVQDNIIKMLPLNMLSEVLILLPLNLV